MASESLFVRENPFQPSKELNDFLGFDAETNATFCEFVQGDQLFNLCGDYVVNFTEQSFIFSPKPNASKATIILERLARIAKQHKDLKNLADDEKEAMKEEQKKKDDIEDAKLNNKVITSLGLGLHQFQWNNHNLFCLHQSLGSPVASYCRPNPQFYENLVLFVKGQQNEQILNDFCSYLITQNEAKKDSLFFKIYQFNVQQKYWRVSGKKIARDPDTIILPTKTWKALINDFERFIDEKSIKWYFEHGIPYKRSYLFYGVPGSGKSSLIQALAAKYDRNLCFLQSSHPKMTDETFKTSISTAPSNSLIVLEDIDALFGKDRSKKHQQCPLTFSGLLNGLDGVGNPDGQIFIMTTNFVDNLDNALIRSGRVDLHIEFPLATDEQLQNMFLLFYPNSVENAKQFVTEVRGNFVDGISMAAVQQHFIQNMFVEPLEVIQKVKQLGDRLDVITRFDLKDKEMDEKEEKAKEVEQENKGKEEVAK